MTLKNKISWRFLILAYSGLFILGLADNGRGPAYPLWLQSFKVTAGVGSIIFSLASFSGLVTTISARFWLPKLGTVRGTQFFLTIISLSLLTTFLAQELALPFSILILASLFLGIGMGGTGITMNLLVGEATPLHLQKNAYAGLHSFYGLSSLLAPFLFGTLQLRGINWNYYFLGVLFFSILLLLAGPYKVEQQESKEKRNSLRAPINLRLMFGIMAGSYVSAEILVSSRLVFYLKEGLGFERIDSTWELSKFFLCLAGGRIFFSFVRLPGRSAPWLIFSLLTSIAIFVTSLLGYPKLLAYIGLSISYFFPFTLALINKTFPEHSQGIITSCMTSVGVFLVIVHLLTGQVAQHFGVHLVMVLGPILLTISLIMLSYLIFKLKIDG